MFIYLKPSLDNNNNNNNIQNMFSKQFSWTGSSDSDSDSDSESNSKSENVLKDDTKEEEKEVIEKSNLTIELLDDTKEEEESNSTIELSDDTNKTVYMFPVFSEREINEFFEGLDIVDINIPINWETAKSRGFAFVTFSNINDFNTALDMNDRMIDSRNIIISIPKNKKQTSCLNKTIKITGLPEGTRESLINNIFEGLDIDHINIKKNANGKCKGFAFVTFDSIKQASDALRKDGIIINGNKLKMKVAIKQNNHNNHDNKTRFINYQRNHRNVNKCKERKIDNRSNNTFSVLFEEEC